MSKTIITTDVNANEAVNYKEAINRMFIEIRQANEKMEYDQEEVKRLNAETREILARLKTA